jgi:hypothetical protein
MCFAISAALIALLWLYSDYMLEQYALSISTSGNQWTMVAIGWEIIPLIWPVLLMAMVAASAATFFVMRRLGSK